MRHIYFCHTDSSRGLWRTRCCCLSAWGPPPPPSPPSPPSPPWRSSLWSPGSGTVQSPQLWDHHHHQYLYWRLKEALMMWRLRPLNIHTWAQESRTASPWSAAQQTGRWGGWRRRWWPWGAAQRPWRTCTRGGCCPCRGLDRSGCCRCAPPRRHWWPIWGVFNVINGVMLVACPGPRD